MKNTNGDHLTSTSSRLIRKWQNSVRRGLCWRKRACLSSILVVLHNLAMATINFSSLPRESTDKMPQCDHYCNRTNFRTRFNFVYFVLLAESTKFSSIRKPHTYACVSDTTVAVWKFLAYESWQMLEYEIFTRTKISAITVPKVKWTCSGAPEARVKRSPHRKIEV